MTKRRIGQPLAVSRNCFGAVQKKLEQRQACARGMSHRRSMRCQTQHQRGRFSARRKAWSTLPSTHVEMASYTSAEARGFIPDPVGGMGMARRIVGIDSLPEDRWSGTSKVAEIPAGGPQK